MVRSTLEESGRTLASAYWPLPVEIGRKVEDLSHREELRDSMYLLDDCTKVEALSPEHDLPGRGVEVPKRVLLSDAAVDDVAVCEVAIYEVVRLRARPPRVDAFVEVLEMVSHARRLERRVLLDLGAITKILALDRRSSTLAPEDFREIGRRSEEVLDSCPRIVGRRH